MEGGALNLEVSQKMGKSGRSKSKELPSHATFVLLIMKY